MKIRNLYKFCIVTMFLIVVTINSQNVLSCIPYFDPATPSIFYATEDLEFYFVLNASCDNESHLPLTFTSTAHDANISFDSFYMTPSGIINFTPTNNDLTKKNGTYGFHIVVEDVEKDATLKYVTFIINNTNDPPNITNPAPQNYSWPNISATIKEGNALMINATILDDDLLTYLSDNITVVWLINGTTNFSVLNYSLEPITKLNQTNITAIYTPTYSDAINGSSIYEIMLVVSDSENATANMTWFVNVTNENRAPYLVKNFSNITLLEDTLNESILDIDEYFIDPDLDDYPLNYSYVFINGSNTNFNITFIENNISSHNLSIKPLNNYFGNDTIIKFYVSDGYNITYSGNITIFVIPVNDAPIINFIPNQTAFPGSEFILKVNATDPDSDILNYSNSHTELFNISQDGLINFTPTQDQIGLYNIQINVTDGIEITTIDFWLNIKNNTIPSFDAIVFSNATENQYFYMNITGIDDDDEFLYFNTSFPYFNMNRTGNKSFDIYFTPTQEIIDSIAGSFVNNDINFTVIFYVNDSKVQNYTEINLTIFNINYTPQIQPIENQVARVNKTFTIYAIASDLDSYPGRQEFTYNDDTPLFDINPLTGLINFTPTASDIGEYLINISVNDTSGLWNYTLLNLTIINNTAPVFVDYPTELICKKGYLCVFDVNATDDTNDTITYYNNNTELFVINQETGLISFIPNKTMIGNYTILLIASDGELNSSVEFNLTIRDANTAPYFDPPLENYSEWLNISEDYEFIIIAPAYDDENDSLIFNVTFNDGKELFNVTNYYLNNYTMYINFTPNASHVGNYMANFTVSDGNLSNNVTINFTIKHTNHAPKISNYYAVNLVTLEYFNTTEINMTETEALNITINITDKDIYYFNDNITYKWYIDNYLINSTSGNETSNSFIYSTDYGSQGIHNITVNVTDTYNESATLSLIINVSNLNRNPIFGTFYFDKINFENYLKVNTTINNDGLVLQNPGAGYYKSGYMVSDIIDFKEDAFMSYSYISWHSTEFDEVNVTIKISNSYSTNNFNESWLAINNTIINLTPKRYLRYNITLTTNNTTITPILNNVTINYKISDVVIDQNTIMKWIDLDNFFIDPDNDTLIFNFIGNQNITLEINSSTNVVTIIPNSDFYGNETFYITATDGYANVTSNNITIQVIEVPPERDVEYIYISSGSTEYVPVPLIQEKRVQVPLGDEILVVKNITTTENNSAIIILEIRNILNETITDTELEATSENPNILLYFDTDKFDKIFNGESKYVTLYVTSYKTYGTYEIYVKLKSSKPELKITKPIFISSIEKGEENKTEINTKMAFARDLLKSSPECLELYETLRRAEQLNAENKIKEATDLLEKVVKDCNTLIEKSNRFEEQPRSVRTASKYLLVIGLIAAAGTIFWVSVNLIKSKKKKYYE